MAEIRRLRAEEWRTLRSLRLAALGESPAAFGRTLADERAYSDDSWREMAAGVIYVAIERDEPVAMAGAYDAGDGTFGIWGMWVAPDLRGAGIGRALLDALIAWGRDQRFATALLDVSEANRTAHELYVAAGFEPTGQTRPLRPGSGITVLEMRRGV